jgi:hypothetical protein
MKCKLKFIYLHFAGFPEPGAAGAIDGQRSLRPHRTQRSGPEAEALCQELRHQQSPAWHARQVSNERGN